MTKTRTSPWLRIAAALALAASAAPAAATLLDRGPLDPVLQFPTWYRDLNGTAVSMCLSQTPSPNVGGAAPMCFPQNPDPKGFPGNVGPEVFYSDLNVTLQRGNAGFACRYLAALEATYLPLGQPVHGTETVFARIRITMTVSVPGLYKVTHPFGVELFDVKPADLGPRAVFFTIDMPLGPALDFDSALQGRVGPFPQWDFVDPGYTLSVTNSSGVVETFLGDPNLTHTFTGSPFATNFVRVDGPAGSNLDGGGNDFIQSPLANVVGQKYTKAIPTPLTIKRATYSRDPAKNLVTVDVFATTAPGSQMLLSGPGLPSVQMKGDAAGNYFAHLEVPATVAPTSVTVTNATSNPVNGVSQGLADVVMISAGSAGALFDTASGTLSVTAGTSDLTAPGPALDVAGPWGGLMKNGQYSVVLPAAALPPAKVTVNSAAGGSSTADVVVLAGAPMNKPGAPTAVADAVTTNQNVAVNLDVSANDALVAPAVVSQVVVVSAPTGGTAAPIGINTGVVTYTPGPNFFGADSFQYVLIDSTGAVSNAATVSVTVNFVPVGPTANGDDFAMIQNSVTPLVGRTYSVLANDTASPGTTIDAATVKVTTLPLHGNTTVNADGTITYTPLLKYVGADSYQYTVANSAGIASNAATVNVVVEGGPESLSISKATFVTSKNQWTIVGSTSWFGPTLTRTKITCWNGKGIAVGALLGTAPIDTAGKFQLVPPPLTTPAPDATKIFTCQTTNGGSVSAAVNVQ